MEICRVSVVLPASGNGERFGCALPKQFVPILGEPVILHTIFNFHRLPWIAEIVVVVNKTFLERTRELISRNDLPRVKVVEGCCTRHRSINAGIKALGCETGVVIIQDGVRVFADEDLIRKVTIAARTHGAAGVTRSLVSTVISVDSDNFLEESLNRYLYKASEMPQGFTYDVIRTAYEQATDDDFDHGTECLLLAMKYTGTKAKLIEGPDNLWKVTYRKDIYAAEAMLKEFYLCTRIILEKKPNSDAVDIQNKIMVLCKERRMKIEVVEEENFTPMCNSYVFLPETFCKDAVYNNIELIQSKTTKLPGIQIPTCVVHVFNNTNMDFNQLSTLYDGICKSFDNGIYYGILLNAGGDSSKLALTVSDLLWNRTKSLSGQIFIIR